VTINSIDILRFRQFVHLFLISCQGTTIKEAENAKTTSLESGTNQSFLQFLSEVVSITITAHVSSARRAFPLLMLKAKLPT